MINIQKSYGYFVQRFGAKKTTNGWYGFDCPFCLGSTKMKMAVNFEYEWVKCWKECFAGSIVDFVMAIEGLGYVSAKNFLNDYDSTLSIDVDLLSNFTKAEESEVMLPEGFTGLLDQSGVLSTRARNYLIDRGFNVETLDSKGFGFCRKKAEQKEDNYFGYIIIPFKQKGVLRYFIGRDFIGNFPKYKNPKTEKFGIGKSELFYNEDALGTQSKVYLTEGWADAETMGRAGIASLGWNLSGVQKSKIIRSGCKELVIIADKGFYRKAVETSMQFLDLKKVRVVDFNSPRFKGKKDANEAGRDLVMDELADTAEMSYQKAIEVLNEYENDKDDE